MRHPAIPSALLILLCLSFFGATACNDACTELNRKICACEPNQTLQRACNERANAGSKSLTQEQEAVCEALLDTCSCDALDANDLAACGLALETAP